MEVIEWRFSYTVSLFFTFFLSTVIMLSVLNVCCFLLYCAIKVSFHFINEDVPSDFKLIIVIVTMV